jgi:L-asparagine oxygenase
MSFSVGYALAPELKLGVLPEAPPSVSPSWPVYWEADVGPEARDRLRKQASTFPSPHVDFLHYSVSCRRLAACMPDQLLRSLTLFRTDPDAPGAMVVRGLPVDDNLGPTPPDGGHSDKTTFVTEAVLGAVAQFFGDLYSYMTEKRGEIIQNIVPVPNREHKRSNEGSLLDFLLHTENAYFDFRPDYLLLFGLRADEGGEAATTVAYAKSALRLLSDSVVEGLRQPLYRVGAPESFLDAHGRKLWSEATPIISGSAHYPEVRVNFNGAIALTSIAAAALKEFQEALNAVTMKFVLQPEELLVIDNRKAVHGRTAFNATFGPNARWLQRAYVHSTLWHGRERLVDRLNLFS